jgi:hypothetical protein
MNRLLFSLMLGAALIAPAAVVADDQDHRDDQHHYYYDREHKKHEWNDNEDRAWRKYEEEKHLTHAEFEKASHKVQYDYWKWRAGHPDTP